MRITIKLGLCLTLSGLALTVAHAALADSTYQPYYYDRDNLQFAHVTPQPQAEAPAVPQKNADNYRFAKMEYEAPTTGVSSPASTATAAPAASLNVTPGFAEGVQAIHNADSAVWLSTGATYLNYKESLSPLTDRERGWLPSFAAGASYMNPDNWYFAGEGNVSFGDAPYIGALENINTGTQTPYQDWTHETIANFDAKAGKGFVTSSNSMLIPYGEIGMRYWDRDLRGPYGYVEDYTNFDFLGGLMVQVTPINRLILSAYGSYGLTFAGKMNTADTTLHLGSAGMYKVGGKISYAVTPRIDLFTTIDFDNFRFVNSGLEPDYQTMHYIMEPSSFSNEMSTRAGIAYHFR